MTTVIGIDCATVDAKVGLSVGVLDDERRVLEFARVCSSDRSVVRQIVECLAESPRTLLAFDAPLGWPKPLSQTMALHRAGAALGVEANHLFRRETDRYIRTRFGKQSLDVGADRIARTAHSALEVLGNLREATGLEIPMAWDPAFPERVAAIEVYPAVTFLAHGIPAKGYKKWEQVSARKAILSRLHSLVEIPIDTSAIEVSADALDAAICVIAGFDFLTGDGLPPENLDLAKVEGWIWSRPKRSLAGG